MDITTAIVEIIQALAWPITVLLICYVLREQISDLAERISKGKLKYKDLELEIERDLNEIKAIPEVEKISSTEEFADYLEDHPLFKVAHVAPRAAILEAWCLVEKASSEAFSRKFSSKTIKTEKGTIRTGRMKMKGAFSKEKILAMEKLRSIRNRTAHSPDYQPSIDEAEEFVMYSLALEQDFQNDK
ncbi:hypothetical protein QEH56_23040 [Pelagicoccus enzymogenes]|uniref:hypothetical protein n=1 Tax=Pelagicoccus enzymogenes TaxID=2773457 RepID=UPI00280FB142|nr:hypothetical protein [Pelagicoccus enzymogenes]MDQ8201061.1 hypothetical protein [Pelagicoccus enzymogenes]